MRTLLRLLFPLTLVLTPAAADDLSELRARVAAQQQQIEELKRALDAQQKLLEALARTPAAAAQPAAKTELAGDGKPLAPLSFRIGGADFTPGGYINLMNIYRSTNVGSGPGTSFGNIPFENTAAGRLSESRFTAQNSRVALKVSAVRGKTSIAGYLETDFQGSLPGNAHVSSNSNTMRMRLYWVQLQRGKWEVLGGQSWSLLTPNRTGVSPDPSDILYTQNLDSNYQVGLTWTRAPQFRLVYHASKKWTAALALENPEQYIGAATATPAFFNGQLDNGSLTSTPNTHPDLIAKAAYDDRIGGRKLHIEAAGLFRTFRAAGPAGGTSTAHCFGGSLNMNVDLVKNVRFVLSTFHSQGGGRYIFGLGPDVVAGPDGGLSPVHASSGIVGFEVQATPKDALYAYYGGAYFSRNYSVAAPGQFVGFGFPGSSSAANRSLQEPTVGYTRTFWKNPNYGAVLLMGQYSYVTRSPWFVAAGAPSQARTHMVFTNFRYVLP